MQCALPKPARAAGSRQNPQATRRERPGAFLLPLTRPWACAAPPPKQAFCSAAAQGARPISRRSGDHRDEEWERISTLPLLSSCPRPPESRQHPPGPLAAYLGSQPPSPSMPRCQHVQLDQPSPTRLPLPSQAAGSRPCEMQGQLPRGKQQAPLARSMQLTRMHLAERPAKTGKEERGFWGRAAAAAEGSRAKPINFARARKRPPCRAIQAAFRDAARKRLVALQKHRNPLPAA